MTEHAARSWQNEATENEAEALARWHSGQEARNQFERDVYHQQETRIAAETVAARQLQTRLDNFDLDHARELENG